MKIASFDLEIASELNDLGSLENLGISCAALALSEGLIEDNPVIYWYDSSRLSKERCQRLVEDLQYYDNLGYKLVTWNGCGFDFQVLAHESGMYSECAELALNHIDMMLMVTFVKGHYLGLDKALRGAGLEGKTHDIRLNNGELLTEMSGALAPQLWAQGETEAVLEYLKGDVVQPMLLAQNIEKMKSIRWISNAGKYHSVFVPELKVVRELFDLPLPNISWMTAPPTRAKFVSWMPKDVLEKNGIEV